MPTARTRTAPATPLTEANGFKGFSRHAMGFWHELAAEMTKDWFTANKARYQEQWVTPMTALLDAVAPQLARAYRPLTLGAPKVMRIYRDVRFAKDKTPYKTHIGAVIPLAGATLTDRVCAALYVHMGLEDEFTGAGRYEFDAGQLAAWRKAVAGKPGVALAAVVADLRGAGYVVGGHDDFKRIPKGFAEDHPRAELLKMKGLTVSFPAIPKGLPHKPAFADWLVEHGTRVVPLVRWIAANI